MKFKLMLSLFLFLFAFSLISTYTIAKEEKNKETVVCAVSGEEVLKSEAAGPYNYEGVDYYFGCNNCMSKFKADPEKYINKARTICCGGKMKVDKASAIKVTYEGKDYYFCSEKCKENFDKDPKAYLQKAKAMSKKEAGKCCGSKASKSSKCSGSKSESNDI